MENQDKGGRPETDKETLDTYLRKLEPFLKSGQKLYRACLNAEIPYTTVYDHYNKKDWFSEKIDAFSAYPANLVNNLFFGRLVDISKKKNDLQQLEIDLAAGKIKKEDFPGLAEKYFITPEDWSFIKWYAVNTHATREEYGTRSELTGKDGSPLIPESPLQEVAKMLQELLNPKDDKTNLNTDTGDKGTGTPLL